MRVNICDVCYYEGGPTRPLAERKVVLSKYRISFKNGKGAHLALDVCETHKDFFKTAKNFEEAEKKVDALYGIPERTKPQEEAQPHHAIDMGGPARRVRMRKFPDNIYSRADMIPAATRKRRCRFPGCTTILHCYNKADHCGLHEKVLYQNNVFYLRKKYFVATGQTSSRLRRLTRREVRALRERLQIN